MDRHRRQRHASPTWRVARGVTELLGVFGRFRPTTDARRRSARSTATTCCTTRSKFDGACRSRGHDRQDGAACLAVAGIDQALADKGRAVFARATRRAGGCVACHGETKRRRSTAPGRRRSSTSAPIERRGTSWQATRSTPADMAGASIPGRMSRLCKSNDTSGLEPAARRGRRNAGRCSRRRGLAQASGGGARARRRSPTAACRSRACTVASMLVENGYEARVLHGIWAAAALSPRRRRADAGRPARAGSEKRRSSFAIGTTYDTARVGLAAANSRPALSCCTTTGCDDLASEPQRLRPRLRHPIFPARTRRRSSNI